ncbi:MAG: cytochrome b N-terminal domain-containing protein, partial [Pseudomonadota bacterium]|nr:cytochrome b N-terminal domain-containing protein [Pseudomonadota bacterium]
AQAFASVEYIMRDVSWGWLIRYMHSTGASLFFVVIYLHMFRGILYGSYKNPRELVWLFGMLVYLLLMAEAFMGYLLPWGQMSYWGAQVIISLFGAIPFGIGDALTLWIRGDYAVGDPTLNRFFALHVVAIPILLIGLVFFHIIALHEVGSNNPDGIEIKQHKGPDGKPLDGIPFHPYYTVKDLFGVGVFLLIFFGIVFFAPEMANRFLERDNFIAANPMVTPEHIAPLWYFAPFYAILRAIPDKLLGVVGMGAAIGLFFLLPWLDRCKVKSIRYRGPLCKIAIVSFAIAFVGLGILGSIPVSDMRTLLARILSAVYFAFFLLMPIYTSIDKTKPVPDRVTH